MLGWRNSQFLEVVGLRLPREMKRLQSCRILPVIFLESHRSTSAQALKQEKAPTFFLATYKRRARPGTSTRTTSTSMGLLTLVALSMAVLCACDFAYLALTV